MGDARERRGQREAVRGLVNIGKGLWASTAPRPPVMDGETDPRTKDMEGCWFTFCWPCFCSCHQQEATGLDSLRYKNTLCWLLYAIPIPCPSSVWVRQQSDPEVFNQEPNKGTKPDQYTGPHRKCGGPSCSCLCIKMDRA